MSHFTERETETQRGVTFTVTGQSWEQPCPPAWPLESHHANESLGGAPLTYRTPRLHPTLPRLFLTCRPWLVGPKPSPLQVLLYPLHTSQTMAPQVGNWISSSLRPRSSAKPCRLELKKMFLSQCWAHTLGLGGKAASTVTSNLESCALVTTGRSGWSLSQEDEPGGPVQGQSCCP